MKRHSCPFCQCSPIRRGVTFNPHAEFFPLVMAVDRLLHPHGRRPA